MRLDLVLECTAHVLVEEAQLVVPRLQVNEDERHDIWMMQLLQAAHGP